MTLGTPLRITRTPNAWLTTSTARPARIASATLGEAPGKRTKAATHITTIAAITTAIATPMAPKTAPSSGVAMLKCEATPRHFCIPISASSAANARTSEALSSHPSHRRNDMWVIAQASERQVTATEKPNTAGLRHE